MADLDYSAETWRAIPSAPNYAVSSMGRVRRERGGSGTRAGKVLAQAINSTGRACVTLSHDGALRSAKVHRLVTEAFHGPAPVGKYLVCHRDGNPLNNSAANLYYGDASDNGKDASRHGTIANGPRNGNSKITEEQARLIITDPRTATDLAREIGISVSTACRIRKGETWQHLHGTLR